MDNEPQQSWYIRIAELILSKEGIVGLMAIAMMGSLIVERQMYSQEQVDVIAAILKGIEQSNQIEERHVELFERLVESTETEGVDRKRIIDLLEQSLNRRRPCEDEDEP